jgi:hypothetical protein
MSQQPLLKRTAHLERSLRRSRVLGDYYAHDLAHVFDIPTVLQTIAQRKQFASFLSSPSSPSVRRSDADVEIWLPQMLHRICHANRVVAGVEQLRSRVFDSSDPEDQQLLDSLWSALRPMERRVSAHDWQMLGFQGMHPETDFRRTGMLSLHCMIAFATTNPDTARKLLLESKCAAPTDLRWYPFALAAIHMADEVARRAGNRELNALFYGAVDHAGELLEPFYRVFVSVLVRFHEYWMKGNFQVMEFEAAKARFFATHRMEL